MGAARADESTVLIVRANGDERIVVSLRAELVSYRFNVLEIAPHGQTQKEPLAGLAERYDAQAALRAQPEKFGVEIWVAGSDAASHEELVTIEASERPELLATRVTEAMRARGLRLPEPPEVSAAPQPAAGERAPAPQPSAAGASAPELPDAVPIEPPAPTPETVPPNPKPAAEPPPKPKPAPEPTAEKPKPKPAAEKPQPVKAPPRPHVNPVAARPVEPTEPTSPRDSSAAISGEGPTTSKNALLYLELSPAGSFHPGRGLGPSFDIWADVRVQPYSTTSLSAFALVPLVQAPIQREAGNADVRMTAIGGAADLHVPVDPFALSVGMGAASLLTSIKGRANAPNEDRSTPQRTMAFFVRVGGGYQLASTLRLTARVLIGFAVPELQIKFAGQPVASWGRPLVVATLGLELALPWQR